MSYPRLFTIPGMGDLAESIDTLRHEWAQSGDKPFPAPGGDGTGSPTAKAQAGYHMDFVSKKIQEGKHSWRDLMRMRMNNLFATKKQDELKDHLLGLMALCAEWYADLEGRNDD